jgi:hypothetical protein
MLNWLTTNAGIFVLALAVTLLLLAGAVTWLALRLRRIEARYHALTQGTDGGSLETVLADHVAEVRVATSRVAELDELTRRLERASRGHLQRVGFLRFNPFRDAGGDQSFAVALADREGNGLVISSLHSRDSTRVYGKPLVAWESAYQLTHEEQQVIRQARGE